MDFLTLSYIFLSAYFVALLIIAYTNGKLESSEEYAIADRKVGVLQTAASMTSGMRDGAGITVWITLSILFGFYTFLFYVGMACALLLAYMRVAKIRRMAVEYSSVTLSDFLSSAIGKRTALVGTLVFLVSSFLYATSQVSVAGELFHSVFGISQFIGILVAVSVVAIYLFLGGYKTVVKTDYFQWLLLFVIALVPFTFVSSDLSSLNYWGIMPVDWTLIGGVTLLSFVLTYSNYADLWQRIFSSQSEETAKKSLLVGVSAYAVISFALTATGVLTGQFFGGMPEAVNPFIELIQSEAIPAVIASLLGVVLLSAMMSTLDSHTFAFSQLFSRNLLRKKGDDAVKYTKVITVVALALIVVLSSTVNDFVSFFFGAISVMTVFAPVMFMKSFDLFSSRDKCDTQISIITASATVIYLLLFYLGYFENVLFILVPALGVLVALSFLEVYYRLRLP